MSSVIVGRGSVCPMLELPFGFREICFCDSFIAPPPLPHTHTYIQPLVLSGVTSLMLSRGTTLMLSRRTTLMLS